MRVNVPRFGKRKATNQKADCNQAKYGCSGFQAPRSLLAANIASLQTCP
jgi:hypothetical protein